MLRIRLFLTCKFAVKLPYSIMFGSQDCLFRAQGAAIGFESALTLAILLSKATQSTQIPNLLQLYHSIREPRVAQVVRASKKTGEIWTMPDGPLQTERDRQFRTEIPPSIGYPNPLEDPFLQSWLWGFDVKKAAEAAWRMYSS